MRRVLGITAEYNPMTNGHKYHLDTSKEQANPDIVVIAMSGDFVQRGEPAIIDKWDRAKAAILEGADIVVEIPTRFSCNSAPYFAKAGVEILEAFGANVISFGAEARDIEDLKKVASILANEESFSYTNSSYPKARREYVAQKYGEELAKILDSPNNILALEYLKYMTAEPLVINRTESDYSSEDINTKFPSATAVRKLMKEDKEFSSFVPESVKDFRYELDEKILFALIEKTVLNMSGDELDKILQGGEGLGNKLKNEIRKVNSYEELVGALKSKRYTRTRIQRFLIHVLLKTESFNDSITEYRILGLSESGASYLKELKKEKPEMVILTNVNDNTPNYEPEILASDTWNLLNNKPLYMNSDYVKVPFIKK